MSGIPEEADEDTVVKILELMEYLGYQVEADEIERWFIQSQTVQ